MIRTIYQAALGTSMILGAAVYRMRNRRLKMPLKKFRVEWAIDVMALSPRRAAEKAVKHQRNPNTTATKYVVVNEDSSSAVDVDLSQPVTIEGLSPDELELVIRDQLLEMEHDILNKSIKDRLAWLRLQGWSDESIIEFVEASE